MAKIRIEDIVFFIFIAIIVGTSLWLLHGSPPEIDAMVSIGLAVAGSELFLWKYVLNLDKKTSLGFIRVKHNIEKNHLEITNRLNLMENNINNKLDKIILK